MRSFAAVVLAALTTECNAWWGTGHLMVARAAYDILQSEAPAALSAANAELSNFSKTSLTDDENNYPFVECATFADNIKGQGYSFQSNWHYVDQPYLNEGGSLSDYSFVMDEYTVSDAITDLTAYLKDGDKSSYYYNKIHGYFPNEADARSFALRLVIHYVGDIHQPLHATAEVNSQFPSGDRGGNSQWIPNKDGAGNLHAVWDSVIYQHTGYPSLPMSSSAWNSLGSNVDAITSQYSVPSKKYYDADAYAWADESLAISESDVYPGYVFNTPLSDAYVSNAEGVANSRLVYGGRRLANLMKHIYGNSAEFTQ